MWYSQASDDSLMSNDENVLLPLELHDDRLEPDDNVPVGLSSTVSVVVLVLERRAEGQRSGSSWCSDQRGREETNRI